MQAARAAAMAGGTVLLHRTVVRRELVCWIAGEVVQCWVGCGCEEILAAGRK